MCEAEFHGEVMQRFKVKMVYGKISIERAFAVSSNIGVMRVIEKFYSKQPEKFMKGLRRMGLGDPIGIRNSRRRSAFNKKSFR